MAKREKRISINAFERAAEKECPAVRAENWNDIDVTIRYTLPLLDMLAFTKDIVESAFTSSGDFVPELVEFAIKDGILTRYANFTMPDNIEKQYWLIYNTSAVAFVAEFINKGQLQEIINAANRKIENLCENNAVMIRAKVDELIAAFEGVQKQTESMFGGLTQDDLQALLSAAQGGEGLSEEKVVEAYLDVMKREAAEQPALQVVDGGLGATKE